MVLLSVCIGVGGWGWPSSLAVWQIGTAVFALMMRVLSSASAADDMTAYIFCKNIQDGPIICWYVVSPCHKHVSAHAAACLWFR